MSEATVDVTDLRPTGGPDDPEDQRAGDAPLREDIRLLGRVLGEVVREQAGQEVFDVVEAARVEAFRIRRSEVDRTG
ncbi:MAG: Phosphoenolpyruvate carboxylase, partial [Klenkia sp.]|nr:Phosphoenolpyruvate carboxylase [Klenkia sp.]